MERGIHLNVVNLFLANLSVTSAKSTILVLKPASSSHRLLIAMLNKCGELNGPMVEMRKFFSGTPTTTVVSFHNAYMRPIVWTSLGGIMLIDPRFKQTRSLWPLSV